MDIKKALEEKRPIIDSVIEKYAPRKIDEKKAEYIFGKPRYAYDVDTLNAGLFEPIWNLLDRGGKRWRPALFIMAVEALGGNIDKIKDIVVIPELVHNGTLCVDDVEDSSELRRGKPCVHKVYGVDVAVNTGNALYYLPLLSLIKNRDKFDDKTLVAAYEVYTQEMINVSAGQGMDIWWHKHGKLNLKEDEYLQMCAYKTGTLARMSAKLAAIFAGGSQKQIDALGKFAETIGVAFQIQDDILNLTPSALSEMKGIGEDIHEGKRTLLVIRAMQKLPKKKSERLVEILQMHTSNQKIIDEAIALIKETDAFDYCTQRASDLVSQAWKELDPLLKPSNAKLQLKAFADYLVQRQV